MGSTPDIKVHYEAVRRNPDNPLLGMPESVQDMILNDPFNTTGRNPLPATMMSQYSTTYNMLRACVAYRQSGQQVVVVGPRMQEAFANTSLKDVNTSYVRLPHRCFYLATPGCKLRLWGGKDTGWHTIAGVYVMEDPMQPGLISFLVWGAANEKSVSELDDATFWFCLRVGSNGGTADLDSQFKAYLNDDELRRGTLPNIDLESKMIRDRRATPTLDLDHRIDLVLSDADNDISDQGQRIEGNPNDALPELKHGVQAILRIALNTVLYMNSASCESLEDSHKEREAKRKDLESSLGRKKHKNGKDAKKLARELEKLPSYRVTWIGPTIEQARGGDNDLTHTRTVKGHVRRGHWHTYLTGPRKDVHGDRIDASNRKPVLKWLPPTWVAGGADTDEPRVYAVKEPT